MTVCLGIRLLWSSPRTRETHTYCRAFSSGAVTNCFYDLGLWRLGFEHPCHQSALAPLAGPMLEPTAPPPRSILHSDIYRGGLQFRGIATIFMHYHDMHCTLSGNCKYISFNPYVHFLNVTLTNSMHNTTLC